MPFMPPPSGPSNLPKDWVDIKVKYTHYGEYEYFATFVVSLGERAAPTNDRNCYVARVWAGDTLIIDRTRSQAKPGINMTFYPGTQDQSEVFRGMHYRGLMCLKFTDFPLKDYGNNIPPITAEIIDGISGQSVAGQFTGVIGSLVFNKAFHFEIEQDRDLYRSVEIGIGSVSMFPALKPFFINRRLSTKATSARIPGNTRFSVNPFTDGETCFAFVPGTDMVVGQADQPGIKRLWEFSSGIERSQFGGDIEAGQNSTGQMTVWGMCLGFGVTSGGTTDSYVIGTKNVASGLGDWPVGILSAQSNLLAYAWGQDEAFATEPQCLTRGARRDGESDVVVTLPGSLQILSVGRRGSAGGLLPTVDVATFYTHSGGGTLWAAFYSPLDETFVVLIDDGATFRARKVTMAGATVWTSDPFTQPPEFTPRERSQIASADLRGNSLVVRVKDVYYDVTYIDTLTGETNTVIFASIPTFAGNFPAIWEGAGGTLYSAGKDFVSLNVPVEVDYDMGDFLRQLAIRVGYDDADIFTEGMDGMELAGYVISGQTTLAAVANQLGQLFGFNWTERAGQIIFKYNYDDNGELVTDMIVPPERLAQLSEGENAGHNAVSRQSDVSFPLVTSLSYYDVDNDYQAGFQRAPRSQFPHKTQYSESKVDMVVPVVLTSTKALELLYGMVYRVWATKVGFAIRLPAEGMLLDGGDAVQWTADGYQYDGIVVKTTINADNSVSLSMVEAQTGSYPVAVEVQDPIRPPRNVEGLPVNTLVLDIPNWKPEQDRPDTLNLWVFMSGYEEDDFNGGRLEMAKSAAPDNYEAKLTFAASEASHIGTIVDDIESNTNPWDVDDVGVIRIKRGSIPEARFETATDEEMVAGKNLVVIGKPGTAEIISFGDFTIVDEDTVEVSHLMRGRFGTEGNINEAEMGDFFAFLDTAKPVTYTVDDFRDNVSFLWRALSPGQPYWQVDSTYIAPQGNSRKPYAPVLATAVRFEGGDVGISWSRRARFYNSPDYDFTVPPPLDEPVESYIVDVMSPDYGVLIRRINGIATPNVTYTLGQQVEDGTNEGIDFNFVIYMVNSSHVGKGFAGGGGFTGVVVAGELYVSVNGGGNVDIELLDIPPGELYVVVNGGGEAEIAPNFTGLLFLEVEGGGAASIAPQSGGLLAVNVNAGGAVDIELGSYGPFVEKVAETTGYETTGATSRFVPFPAGGKIGDLLAITFTMGVTNSTLGPSPNTGWTLSANSGVITNLDNHTWTRRLTKADIAAGGWTFTSSNVPIMWNAIIWRNVRAFNASAGWVSSAASNFSMNQVLTLGDDSLLVDFISGYYVGTIASGSAEMVEFYEDTQSGIGTTGGYASASLWDGGQVRPNVTYNYSASASRRSANVMAFSPYSQDHRYPYGAHRYWRILMVANTSGNFELNEVEMRTTFGGADQCAGGTAAARSGTAANAFDNNTGTVWTATGLVPYDQWVSYDFGSGVTKNIIEVVLGIGTNNVRAPTAFKVQYSDDNSRWYTAWTVDPTTTWAANTTKTFQNPKAVLDNPVDPIGNTQPVIRSSSIATTISGNTLVFPKPAGLVVNDLLVVGLSGPFLYVNATPPGWTQHVDYNGYAMALTKLADAGDVAGSTISLTYSTYYGKPIAGVMLAVAFVDTAAPVEASAVLINTMYAQPQSPSLTPTDTNRLLLCLTTMPYYTENVAPVDMNMIAQTGVAATGSATWPRPGAAVAVAAKALGTTTTATGVKQWSTSFPARGHHYSLLIKGADMVSVDQTSPTSDSSTVTTDRA